MQHGSCRRIRGWPIISARFMSSRKRLRRRSTCIGSQLATPQGNVPGGQWDETRSRLAKLTGTKAPTGMELLRGDPNGNELSQLAHREAEATGSGFCHSGVLSAIQPWAEGTRSGVHQRLRKAEARHEGLVGNKLSGCFPGRQFGPPAAARDRDVFGCLRMHRRPVHAELSEFC